MKIYDLIVIGGGAAGYFGALSAAQADPKLCVLILEQNKQPLNKVRISGGGRCNVTHACFDPAELITYYPRGSKELRGPFSRFQPGDTVDWFAQRGIDLKTEPDGRMFPTTDDSQTIIDCFLNEAKRYKIEFRPNSTVIGLTVIKAGFSIQIKNQESLTTRKILFVPGGGSKSAYAMLKDLGHTLISPVPSLFTFNIRDARLRNLGGIAVKDTILTLNPANGQSLQMTGPTLITHWGLSGPAVLKLSAWGARMLHETNYKMPLQVNWLPHFTPEKITATLHKRRETQPRKQVSTQSPFPEISSRLWERFTLASEIEATARWADIGNKPFARLTQELSAGEFHIRGKGAFKDEFVTAGGVSLKEVDFKTMESKIQPGLYLAGEILDMDALTGGFNFQAAWTTSWLAGQAIGNAQS